MQTPNTRMRADRRSGLISLGLIGGLGLLLTGVLVGYFLAPQQGPSELAAPVDGSYPVAEELFDDARDVELDIGFAESTSLTVNRPGTVTAVSCEVGKPVSSGTTPIEIDGQAVLALATSKPLWRELKNGDSGEDVDALRAALADLGAPLDRTGSLNSSVLAAVADFIGEPHETVKSVNPGMFIWLSDQGGLVESCPLRVGMRAEENAAAIHISGAVESAQVVDYPRDVATGAHVLQVGEQGIAVDDSGRIADSDLAKLAASSEVQHARMQLAGAPANGNSDAGTDATNSSTSSEAQHATLTVMLSLATPRTVGSVSPAALFGTVGTKACMTDGAEIVPVTVLGSRTGVTFVEPAGEKPLPHVATAPNDLSLTCSHAT